VQIIQDISFCKRRYPNAICKPIALQFLTRNDVAILELDVSDSDDKYHLSIVDERHYNLVDKDGISDDEIKQVSDSEI
jgi:hypothetical protein